MSLASDLGVTDSPAQTGVGVIMPSDFERDRELWRWAPEHVSLHLTRLPTDASRAAIRRLTAKAARHLSDYAAIRSATLNLLAPRPALVAYACAAGSFIHGAAGERAICKTILDAGASAACTTSGALVDEMHLLGVSRLELVTPYPISTTRRLTAFLAEHDLTVTGTVPLGQLAALRAAESTEAARQLRVHACHGTEAIFFCCTNIPTYDLIQPLATALSRPVLTANEVLMHAALRALDRSEDTAARPPGSSTGRSPQGPTL